MHFIKSNHSSNNALQAEVQSLELLRQTILSNGIAELSIPQVHSVSDSKLTTEFIEAINPSNEQWRQLGLGLAKLHSVTQSSFGFAADNYIGLNPQLNTWSNDWAWFFVNYRLLPQIKWINHSTKKSWAMQVLQQNNSNIIDYLSENSAQPSLVHGDLWSGNVLFSEEGVWLIDPACYFADSEVDIAMTELFGGFSTEFYSSYKQHKSLSSQYQTKKQIYNLYHYLNHYNLFGSSYWQECEHGIEVLRKI